MNAPALEGGVLVWRFPEPLMAVATAPLGGGIGLRAWVVNAQVERGYDRRDPAVHLAEIAAGLGLAGEGVGFLTAVDVRRFSTADDSGVRVDATVGVSDPVRAADPDAREAAPTAGTINVVASVPARLSPAALVNAVATATEAKVQALAEAGVVGTGTPTDAVAVLCRPGGPEEPYGGPRSAWGAPLARAVYAAVTAGLA